MENSKEFWFPAFRCWCLWPQVGQHPGRRVSAAAFALCGWTASPWTWRREQRSPQGSKPVVQATAAATEHSARTRDAVWREPTALPVTVAHLLILEPSVREVLTNWSSSSSVLQHDVLQQQKCFFNHITISYKCTNTAALNFYYIPVSRGFGHL